MFWLMDHDKEKQNGLERALDQWRVSTPLPPRFQEQVWRKIEGAQAAQRISLREVISRWLENVMPRPAAAASYVGVLLVAGLVAGIWQAQEHNVQAEQTFARKYVQSVDPYQAPRFQ
jgi:hypothetical protein